MFIIILVLFYNFYFCHLFLSFILINHLFHLLFIIPTKTLTHLLLKIPPTKPPPTPPVIIL